MRESISAPLFKQSLNDMKLHEKHEELMHYTNALGLQGIVTSKVLWASHASFLNDSEEVVGFFSRVFPQILRPVVEHYFTNSEELSAFNQTAGGFGVNLIDYYLHKLVDGFREAETRAEDHYVLSFCAPIDEWTAKNGLLSQWRGYGVDGGYAIVFGTKELEEILIREREIYHEEGGEAGAKSNTI